MSAGLTHHFVAQKASENLSAPLRQKLTPYLNLYFFGAQGADFCFFYPTLTEGNLGSYLHRKGGYSAFQVCKAFSSKNDLLFAYSLGFITHYCADVTFHPYVYATAGKSPLRHSRVERAIDLYLRDRVNGANDYLDRFNQPLTQKAIDELFLLYAVIAAKVGFPPLHKPAFKRALNLFNAYLPRSSVILSEKNVRLYETLANHKNDEWAYPAAPYIKSRANARTLFDKAVSFSSQAIRAFVRATEEKTPLPFSIFGKHYLSGL